MEPRTMAPYRCAVAFVSMLSGKKKGWRGVMMYCLLVPLLRLQSVARQLNHALYQI